MCVRFFFRFFFLPSFGVYFLRCVKKKSVVVEAVQRPPMKQLCCSSYTRKYFFRQTFQKRTNDDICLLNHVELSPEICIESLRWRKCVKFSME